VRFLGFRLQLDQTNDVPLTYDDSSSDEELDEDVHMADDRAEGYETDVVPAGGEPEGETLTDAEAEFESM
jgi:hypothetical protein